MQARRIVLFAALLVGSLSASCLMNSARADTVYYFDTNGATAGSGVTNVGSYNWSSGDWSTSSAGTLTTVTPGWGGGTNNDVVFSAGTDGGSDAYTVTLNGGGAQTWVNNVTVNSGNPTIAVNGGNFVLGGNYTWTIAAGSTLTVNGNGSGSWGDLNLNGATLTVAGGGNMVIGGMGNSGGGVTMSGAGVLTVNGASSYSGATVISSGTVQVGSGGSAGTLGSGGITDNAMLVFDRGDTALVMSQVISGSGAVVQIGGGMVTLSAANTFTGNTLISAGTLALGNASALQYSTLDTSGPGTLSFGGLTTATVGGLINGGTVTLTNTNSASVNLSVGNNTTTFAGTLAGGGGLIKGGTGVLTLTGNNSYGGGTTISGGGLVFSTASALPSTPASNAITLSGGYLGATGPYTAVNDWLNSGLISANPTGGGIALMASSSENINFATAGTGIYAGTYGNLGLGSIGTNTYSGTLTPGNNTYLLGGGGGTLIMQNGLASATGGLVVSGNVTLLAASSYTGGTTISAGTLQVDNGGSTATLGAGAIVNNGALAFSRSDSALTISQGISGSGQVLQIGTGVTTLSANDAYTGGTNISAGTLVVSGYSPAPGTINVAAGAMLQLNTGTAQVTSNAITYTGGGTIQKIGASTYTRTDGTTFTLNLSAGGLLDIEQGDMNGNDWSFRIAATNQGSLNVAANAIFHTDGINQSGAVLPFDALTGGGTIQNLAAANVLTLGVANGGGNWSGVIQGNNWSVNKTGSGTETFSGANTYTGGTSISGGVLNLAGSLAGSNVTVSGATATFNETSTGVIGGSGTTFTLTNGSATLGGANTYTGATTVSGGVLNLAGSLAGSNVTVNGATAAFNETSTGVIGGSGSTFTLTSGSATFGGANTYTGATTINGGALQLGNANALPNSTVTVNVNGGLAFAAGISPTLGGLAGTGNVALTDAASNPVSLTVGGNGASTAYSGALSGSGGSLIKTGNGAMTLSGMSSYTGGTTINAGTLIFSSTASAPAGAQNITINSPGGLGIGGTYPTAASWLTSGLLNPASTGALALTASSSQNINFAGFNSLGLSAVGTQTYSGTITPATNTFNLGGSGGTLVMATALTDGTASQGLLVNGNVILMGANTYSGGTTIGAAVTLQVDNGGSTGTLGSGAILDNGALVFSRSDTGLMVPGGISGSGGVLQNGSGMTTLSGVSTYTGATTVSGGVLNLTGSLFGSTVTVSGATAAFNETSTGAIDGSGTAFTLSNGSATLGGANTYTGPTQVTAGTLNIASGGSVIGSSLVEAVSGGVLTISGSVTVNNGNAFAVASGVAGTSTVVINPGAAVNLAGGTYIGGKLNGSGTNGTGILTINGGIVNVAGADTAPAGGDGSTLWMNPWQGAGAVLNLNGGTLSTARGISDGQSNSANSTVHLNGGVLQAAGSITILNNVTNDVDAGGAIINTQGYNVTVAQPLLHGTGTPDGGLTKLGSGILTLNGAGTYNGGTTIGVGTVQASNNSALGTGTIVLSGGTLEGGNNASLANNLVAVAGTSSGLDAPNGSNLTLNGNLSGSGNINKTDGYSVFLGGNNSAFSGTYTNSASNTFFSNTGGSAGSAAATWVINAGNLDNTASGNPTISLGSLSGTGGNLGNNVANTSVTYFIGALNTSTTFAGTISGSTTGLVKVGSGTLTLSAANSFTGGTTINNGTLQLNVGGQNGTLTGAAVVINNGGTLLANATDALGYSTQGVSGVTINSGGVFNVTVGHRVTLQNAVTMTGGTLTSSTGVGDGNGNYLVDSYINATSDASGNPALINATELALTGPGFNVTRGPGAVDLLVTSVLANWGAGPDGVVKSGNGVMVLNAVNTYTGGTTVSGGTLRFGSGNNQFSTAGAITMAGGLLDLGGYGQTTSGAVAFQSGTLQDGTLTETGSAYAAQSGTVTANLAGPVGLTKTTAGLFVLGGSNTYSGNTLISAGTLSLANSLALQNSTLDTSGAGTLNFGSLSVATIGGLTNGGSLTLQNGSGAALALSVGNNGSSTTYSGAMGGSGSLVKVGGGVLVLGGANSYTGGTTINAGTLIFSSTASAPAGTQNITINSPGGLGFAGAYPTASSWFASNLINPASTGALALTASSDESIDFSVYNNLSLGASGTQTYYGILTPANSTFRLGGGGGTLVMATALTDSGSTSQGVLVNGSVVLSAANTYSGGTTISGGTLQLGNANAIPNSTVTVNVNGGLSFAAGISPTIGGLAGAGNVALTDASSNPIALTVGADGASTAYSGVLSGGGSLVKTGTGTFTISSANTYTGGTTIIGGTLQVGNGGASGTPGTGGISIASNAALAFDRGDSGLVVGGAISGSGSLIQMGGMVTLTNNNSYTGGTTVSAGTLQIGNGNGSGALGTGTVLDNGLLAYTLNGSSGVAMPTAATGSGNLTATAGIIYLNGNINISGSQSYTENYTGTGTFWGIQLNADTTLTGSAISLYGDTGEHNGGNQWALALSTSAANGPINLNISLGANSRWYGLASFTANAGTGPVNVTGTLSSGTSAQTGWQEPVTLAGAMNITANVAESGLTINTNGTTTGSVSGVLLGSAVSGGALTVQGPGMLTLSNTNTYTGTTTISGGTLQLGNGTTDGSVNASSNVVNNGALLYNVAVGQGYANVISGSGSVAKSGPGTLALGGVNTYSGPTSITGGVVQISGPNGLGDYTQATNTIAISGGTLESTGNTYDLGSNRALTLGGPATLQADAGGLTVSGPVTNGANPLTVTGAGNTTISGAIGNGSGGLTMSGAGVLTLSANNSYTGGTTVTNGTVTVTKNNALGTGTVNLAAGANLNISSVASISGLAGNYYNFTPSTNDLSSLATFNATLAGKTPALTSNSATAGASFNFGQTGTGFPYPYNSGTPVFEAQWNGQFNAPTAGSYTFYTASDDGSAIWIDGNEVVNNDYGQAITQRSGAVTLTAGEHNIVIGYFNGGGGYGFYADVAYPGQAEELLPNSLLSTSVPADGTLSIASLSGAAGSTVTLGTGVLTTGSDNTSTTFAGVISGAGGSLVKVGSGVMTLSGANTYTGGTTVGGGMLAVNGSLASAAVTVSAGSLAVNGSLGGTAVTIAGGTVLSGTGTIAGAVSVASGAATTNQGTINLVDGTIGTLTLTNPGTALTLGTSSGSAVLDFEIGANSTDQLALTAGSLNLNSSVTINLTQLGATQLSSGTYNLLSFSGGTGGSGSFTLGSLGGLPASLVSLNTTANDEQLIIQPGMPAVAYWSGAADGTWSNKANWATDVSGGTAVLSVPGSISDVYFTAASGTNLTTTLDTNFAVKSLNYTATSASVAINGTNTLTIATAAGINDPAGSAAQAINANVALGAAQTWTVNSASPLTVGGVISGANTATLTLAGSGTVVLTASNSYTGLTTINAGALQLGNGTTNGSVSGDIVNNASLIVANGTALSYGGNITGSGGVILEGAGAVTLCGANGYSGGTTIDGGAALVLGNASALGTGALALSGSLNLASYSSTVASLSLTGGALTGSGQTLTVSGIAPIDAESGAISANLAGNVALDKTTGGTVVLSGNNNVYTGGTSISAGMVQLGSAAALPNGGNLTVDSGTLDLAGNSPTVGALAGAGGVISNSTGAATLGVNTAASTTFGGTIADGAGTTGLVKNGSGTLALTNAANNYSGGTTVSGGVLQLGSATALGSTLGNLTVNAGTLDLAGNSPTVGALSGASGVISTSTRATLTVGSGDASSAFSGVIVDGVGAVALVKTGAGTLTLAGANGYSGGTTIGGGVLAIGNANNLGSGSVTIGAGTLQTSGNVVLDAARTVTLADPTSTIDTPNQGDLATISGSLGGSGALNKTGAGTLALADTSGATYSGDTNVSAGILDVVADNALSPTSNLVIGDGASVILDFGGGAGSDGIVAFTGGAPALASPALAVPALTPAGISTVPEPSTLMLLAVGVLASLMVWRRRSR